MKQIEAAIQKIHQLKKEELVLFLDKCQERVYTPNTFLVEAGEVCKGVFFVVDGLIGLYDINKTGDIAYYDFFFPQSFATEITSLAQAKASEHWLVAIKHTKVLYCTKESLLELYEIHPNFQTFGRKLLESLLLQKTAFNKVLSTLSAKEKYTYLLEEHPEMIQSIPIKYLASYLGVARETLSRIRQQK